MVEKLSRQPPSALAEVAGVFLRLSLTAFGGPAAHIAMMEDEIVRRRGWMPREEFLDRLGAASLIPGPTSTEMVIYIGYMRGGWPGLIVAGLCFIVPASLMVAGFAWAYTRFAGFPEVGRFLYGLKPVIIAIVGQALWKLARAAVRTRLLTVISLAAIAAAAAGSGALSILAGAGVLAALAHWIHAERRRIKPLAALLATALVVVVAQFWHFASRPAQPKPVSLAALFTYFVKIGSVLFGSGYVLLAFLQQDLVAHWRWLTSKQLLDAVVAGQITPGPLFTTATFIGYLLAGPAGAAVATAGIFLPGFLLCAVSGPVVPWLRRSPIAGAFLDGVNVAAVALMVVVTWQLARTALVDWLTVATAAVCLLLLLRYRAGVSRVALGGALWGLILAGLYKWL